MSIDSDLKIFEKQIVSFIKCLKVYWCLLLSPHIKPVKQEASQILVYLIKFSLTFINFFKQPLFKELFDFCISGSVIASFDPLLIV